MNMIELRKFFKEEVSRLKKKKIFQSFAILSVLFFTTFLFSQKKISKSIKNQVKKDYSKEIASIKWETNPSVESIGDPHAVKGGTLTIALTSAPATLRTYGPNSRSQITSLMTSGMYESLCGLSPLSMRVVPGLADAWYVAPDHKTFYFHINPKARWADGSKVTATDVQRTWDFFTSKFIKDPFINAYYRKYERPEILASDIVKVKAKVKDWRMFMGIYGMEIFPAKELDKMKLYPGDEKNPEKIDYVKDYNFKMIMGSGPYEFDHMIKGKEVVIKRRKDYWDKDSPSGKTTYNFDYWVFKIIRDENLIYEKFKKGEVDIYLVNIAKRWVTETNFDKIQKGWIQKVKVFTDYARGISGFAFNMRVPPFNDVRVRQAFRYLINVKQLVHMLMYDEYLLLDSYFPGSIYQNPDNPKYRYNPDKAVELLKEAGWDHWDENGRLCNKEGKPFVITIPYTAGFDRILTVVQEYLNDVGITLKLKQITPETKWKLVMDRKFTVSYQGWTGSQFPNPRAMWHSSMAGKNTINICGMKDKKVDELIEQYEQWIPFEERVKLLRKLDKRLMELCPYALSYYAPHTRILYWDKFGMPKSVLGKQGSAAVWTGIFYYWYVDPKKEKALKEAIAQNKTLPKRENVQVHFWEKWDKFIKKYEKEGKLPDSVKLQKLFEKFYRNYAKYKKIY
jgi:microcin C transport system substrate-binding protein